MLVCSRTTSWCGYLFRRNERQTSYGKKRDESSRLMYLYDVSSSFRGVSHCLDVQQRQVDGAWIEKKPFFQPSPARLVVNLVSKIERNDDSQPRFVETCHLRQLVHGQTVVEHRVVKT